MHLFSLGASELVLRLEIPRGVDFGKGSFQVLLLLVVFSCRKRGSGDALEHLPCHAARFSLPDCLSAPRLLCRALLLWQNASSSPLVSCYHDRSRPLIRLFSFRIYAHSHYSTVLYSSCLFFPYVPITALPTWLPKSSRAFARLAPRFSPRAVSPFQAEKHATAYPSNAPCAGGSGSVSCSISKGPHRLAA